MKPGDTAIKSMIVSDSMIADARVPEDLRRHAQQIVVRDLRRSGADGRIIWCVTRRPDMQAMEIMGIVGWRAQARRRAYKAYASNPREF